MQQATQPNPTGIALSFDALSRMTDRLSELLEQETLQLRLERPSQFAALVKEKTTLASEISLAMKQAKSRPGQFDHVPEANRRDLLARLARLQELVLSNGRALLKRKSVNEGLLAAIAAEAQKAKAPATTYRPGVAGTAKPGPRVAASIALNAVV